ncbi:MAG: DUF1289 domain-containing protein [Hyphomicrobium sp.]|jgi:predicted Fe-S protein YdhL (DUF1289 family)
MSSVVPIFQRHSPCIGVCRLDEASGLCLGCARTGAEIAGWASMSEAGRDAIWEQLPERLGSLGVRMRLAPWTGEEILAWVAGTVRDKQGTWVVGAPGASAEFPCTDDRDLGVAADDEGVTIRAPDASFRLAASDKLRAFVFADAPVVLGFPKVRISLARFSELTALGADFDAIDTEHRAQEVFDLGLGRQFSRFGLRTSDASLLEVLRGLKGRRWTEVMAAAGADIVAANPTRVVETMLARVEVFSPIAPSPGVPATGARTHFLPPLLATGDEIDATLKLPDYVAPIAVFYPHGSGH